MKKKPSTRVKKSYSKLQLRLKEASPTLFTQSLETEWFNKYANDPYGLLQYAHGEMVGCVACKLGDSRNSVAMPDGKLGSRIMILGQSTNTFDDATGIAFTGVKELQSSNCNKCKKSSTCFTNRIMYRPDAWLKRPSPIKCVPQPVDQIQFPSKCYIKTGGSILDGIIEQEFKGTYPRQNWINECLAKGQPIIPNVSIWYITNLVKCRSFDSARKFDTLPETTFRTICKNWFVMEWLALDPDIIVILGVFALEMFVGKKNVSKVVPGEVFKTAFGPAIYQPAPDDFIKARHIEYKSYGYAKIADTLRKSVDFVMEKYDSK